MNKQRLFRTRLRIGFEDDFIVLDVKHLSEKNYADPADDEKIIWKDSDYDVRRRIQNAGICVTIISIIVGTVGLLL